MPDKFPKLFAKLIRPMRVAPGTRVTLPGDFDPGHTAHFVTEADAGAALEAGVRMLADYQSRLAAQDTYAVLVVLQGLDAAGKDGTVRHVMTGVNPQGVEVRSFKVPTDEELDHDYLWRHERALPRRGTIAIFNRSHYEEVLAVRVHPDALSRERLPSTSLRGAFWRRRFGEINHWERYLVGNGIRVVKVFLNLSREEQRRRLLDRIERPDKNWKFSAADLEERRHWPDYMRAYSDVLTHTSTESAPWYVVPADHKWFARLSVAALIVQALDEINPQYPTLDPEARKLLEQARAELLRSR
jgi:PPK2 family polyphosphate:nucleotide phosphotransferase